jgi:ribonuclease Z
MPESVTDSIFVTLLGTGFPRPLIQRFGPSTLVKAGGLCLIFDCGRGTAQRLYQIEPWDPTKGNAERYDKLFLTHLHSDHTTGIPDLWITGNILGRHKNKLRIWGPRLTEHMMGHLVKAFEPDIKVRFEARVHRGASTNSDGLEMEVEEVDEGFVFEENGVKVAPFRVNHYDEYSEEPSLGYRVEYDGKSVVISGDTRFCENLIKHSMDADLLIHEVAAGPSGVELPPSQSRPMAHHTSPEEAGEVFRRVSPKLAVYNHFIQFQGVTVEEMMNRTKSVYDGPILIGEDLMTFEIDENNVKLVTDP